MTSLPSLSSRCRAQRRHCLAAAFIRHTLVELRTSKTVQPLPMSTRDPRYPYASASPHRVIDLWNCLPPKSPRSPVDDLETHDPSTLDKEPRESPKGIPHLSCTHP